MRVWIDRLIALAAVGFLLLGSALAITDTLARGDQSTTSTRCHDPSEALSSRCYADVPATVRSARLAVDGGGRPHPTLTLHSRSAGIRDVTVELPGLANAGIQPQASDRVALRIYDGMPVAVRAGGWMLPTTFEPSLSSPLRRTGGISLMGISALILMVHPPALAGRRRRLPRALRRGAVGLILRDHPLWLAWSSFTVLQLLDIATTLTGAQVGLFEGNPLAGELATRMGPLSGYFAMKGAAVIAMLLAMTHLPRRAALLIAWGGSAIMGAVVLHNALLIAG